MKVLRLNSFDNDIPETNRTNCTKTAFLKDFFEVGTTFYARNVSRTTLFLFPLKANLSMLAYFNSSIFICDSASSIIGARRTVRDQFNVQTGCQQNY